MLQGLCRGSEEGKGSGVKGSESRCLEEAVQVKFSWKLDEDPSVPRMSKRKYQP